jgi:hypothetical protein
MTTKDNETPAHVAGPWKYHLGRGANPRFHVQTMGGYQIASTPELSKHAQAKEENASREANARLIAAAPELLKALNRLADGFCENVDGEELYGDWIAIAEEAIAKATGEPVMAA